MNGQSLTPYQQALRQAGASKSTLPTITTGKKTLTPYQKALQQAQDPWQGFVKKAVDISNQRGFPAAVTIGQAALESGRGTSNFAKQRNNYFGIGAFDSNPDNAFSYSSPEESINAYLDLVQKYPGVSQVSQSGDPYATLSTIKAGGYATDPNYVQKVMSTPEFQQYAGGNP